MTIKELYEWAQKNDCADYEITIECFDEYASDLEADIDDASMLEKRSYDVAIKCRY